MSDASTPLVDKPRLNPFAFPSDTTLRFVLLLIFVVCGSARLYGDFGEDAGLGLAAGECISKAWSQASSIKTPNSLEDAHKIAAAGGEMISSLADCSKMLRPRVWWSIGGIFLTIAVGLTIYSFYPAWKLYVGRLRRLSTSELPEVDEELGDICRLTDLPAAPIFVWNPMAASLPLAFGRGGRYYVALSGWFISRFFYGDKSAFRGIILHELAHIRNGDVRKTYLVISLWLAFISIAIIPSLLFSLWFLARSRLWDAVAIIIYALLSTVFVVLAGLAVLRAREYYADVRASVWGEVSHIDRALAALPATVGLGWRRFFRSHPGSQERRRIVEDPSGLFRLSYFDSFGIGVAAWSVIDAIQNLGAPFLPAGKWEFFVYYCSLTVIMPAVVLVFSVGVVGIGVWRGAFASLLKGDQPYARTGSLGAALVAGWFPIFLLVLVTGLVQGEPTLLQSLITTFELKFFTAVVLLIACFLIFRWIADASAAWLEVVLCSRSPQPVLATTVGVAFILVTVALALALFFVDLSFMFTPWRNLPNWMYIYDLFMGGPVLFASLVVWAFPLAALWRRKKTLPATPASWVFLDGSSPPLPAPEELQIRDALVAGIGAGLVFWALWEAEYFRIYFPLAISNAIGSAFSWLFAETAQIFGNKDSLLPNSAMTFQALAAAIAAGRARRLSAVCGLFAAFVAGSIIVLGDWLFFGFQQRISELLVASLAMMGQGAVAALPTVIVAASIGVAVRRIFSPVVGTRKLMEPVTVAGLRREVTSEPPSFGTSTLNGQWRSSTRSGFFKGGIAALCVVVAIGMAARVREGVHALQQVNADERSAERGDPAAQYKLGMMHARGQSVEEDAQAVFWLRKAADQHHADAEKELAQMYFNGRGVKQDDVIAIEWLRKAAADGHSDAEFGLASMYASGRGVSKDDGLAFQWVRRAAEHGHAAAQNVLGAFYAQGRGTPRDDAAAVEWLRKSADQDYADAENNLASMYQQGRALPKDDALALQWFHRAAEHGHADAENNLGLMYASGRSVAKDDVAALRWFRRAGEQGHVAAQNNVGVFYALGRGTPRDDGVAVQWLRKAAEHGYANAQKELAIMYEQGRALPKDDALAMQWFRKAAEQGQAEAQFNVAKAYQNGSVVPKDDEQAISWFRKASKGGYSEARDRLQAMCNSGLQAACSIE